MEFNVEPYWDDFEASNGAKEENYMKILFRPGYAVQARELTQIQSILQNQIKQFGDHIFQDGSPVFGGHITLDNSVDYVKLQTAYSGADIDVEDFADRVIFNSTGTAKVRARVIVTDDTQTQPTLMIKYLRGTQFVDNQVITTSDGALAQLVTSSATGSGSVATIQAGVFYVEGFFVTVAEQSIVLDPYGSSPTYRIGLEIDDNIIDESADTNLLDPAQASFNYQAPGANRYQFNLNLAKRELTSTDDSRFFELLRVENGVITKQVKYPIYSELEKTLARRTFDESGNYTVSPFKLTLEANTACTDNFISVVEPGKAYVQGFEFEAIGPQRIETSKARTTKVSSDYDLSVEYGNYIYANSITTSAQGFFDTSKLQELELHCAPTTFINVTNAITYNGTFMGSARVKHFTRDSATEYILYLTDVKLQSNIVTAGTTGANSRALNFPVNYANVANAYQNVSVRITSGASSGDVRKIIDYNPTTRIGVVDTAFSGLIGSGQTFALLYSTLDIDSLVEVVAAKTSLNVKMNVSNSSKDVRGATILYDSNRKSLIFSLPEAYITAGSISNADYVTYKLFESKTFSSNGDFALTLSGNETYDYGTDGSFISNVTANTNIIVTVKSITTATNVAVGEILNNSNTYSGIRRDNQQQLTIFTGANGAFVGDIYARVKLNNTESSSNNRRNKTVRGNAANTSLLSTDSYLNSGVAILGKSSVYLDSVNGHVWFTNTADINKTPGGNNSLYVADVYKLAKVYDSGNPSAMPSTTNAIDITSRYYLDTGQTTEFYDHSKIVLKPGANPPRGQTVAFIEYYEHSAATSGYFDADSYPADQYTDGEIPIFITSDGTRYNLRDCIDFRPTRALGTSASVTGYTFVGGAIPVPYESMELTYAYYIPRRDKIVITSSKEVKIINGVPAKNPEFPPDQTDAMTLFTLDIPAYTANPTDIIVKTIDNKRYTMRDISKLEQRIKNVEYYSALSLVEAKATDTTIFYEDNATQKEKYGIVVDNFTGFDIADTKNPDFTCSIENGAMKPYAKTENFKLVPISKEFQKPAVPALPAKRIWQIPYTETIINNQNTATKTVAVQPPVLTGKFDGDVQLFPSADSWFSVSIPLVPLTSESILPNRVDFAPPNPPSLVADSAPSAPPAPSGSLPNAPALPAPVVPPPPPVELPPVTRAQPASSPSTPPPAFVPPASVATPPAYLSPPPPDLVKIGTGIDYGVLPAPPTNENVDILVLPPPPVSGPAPPTPPAVVIEGTPVPVVDIIGTVVYSPPTDVVGAAPKIIIEETWYKPPIFEQTHID